MAKMQQILSLADHQEESRHFLAERLAEFDEQNQIQTEFQSIPWRSLWTTLRKAALSKGGLDVSEVGTTWVESFARMKALRPFATREIARMGSAENYIQSAWKTATVSDDTRVWAIPWLSDVRVIYYWRDMLDAAGVDEATAFLTFDHMNHTLARLEALGSVMPWATPGERHANASLYQAATWIWGMGGDFVSEDNKHVTFCEPEAIEGISLYFTLLLNVCGHDEFSGVDKVHEQFFNRGLATMMSGTWLLSDLRRQNASDDVFANLGVAVPPGPSFVGGSNLIIWRHIAPRLEKKALALIELLTSPEIQHEYNLLAGTLPPRLEAWDRPPFSTDPYYQVFAEALQRGRSLPTISLWGTIEENLFNAFASIWDRLQENPNQSVESVVLELLEPLAARLDRTLGQV
jgi:multiple sugar transport system substrate-binding protein